MKSKKKRSGSLFDWTKEGQSWTRGVWRMREWRQEMQPRQPSDREGGEIEEFEAKKGTKKEHTDPDPISTHSPKLI